MQRLVDARGKACPEPVVMTRSALLDTQDDVVRVLVDNPGSADNVTRMAASLGWTVTRDAVGPDLRLTLRPPVDAEAGTAPETVPGDAAAVAGTEARVAVLLGSAVLGQGDDALGARLMGGFVKTLQQVVPRLATVVLVNGGVRLAVESQETVEALRELERCGVTVLACGTCLEHFGLTDRLAAGRVSNMFEIVDALTRASQVIRP